MSPCDSGLVCSSKGALKNICLKGNGQKCGSNNECVNFVACIQSTCKCQV